MIEKNSKIILCVQIYNINTFNTAITDNLSHTAKGAYTYILRNIKLVNNQTIAQI